MNLGLPQFIAIIAGIFTVIFIQGGMVFGGSRLAGIKQATYLDSLIITIKCWCISIITMPLVGIPILGIVLNIIAHFLIPTLVIKSKYRVQMEKAFWAAFAYLSISALVIFGLALFLKDQ